MRIGSFSEFEEGRAQGVITVSDIPKHLIRLRREEEGKYVLAFLRVGVRFFSVLCDIPMGGMSWASVLTSEACCYISPWLLSLRMSPISLGFLCS